MKSIICFILAGILTSYSRGNTTKDNPDILLLSRESSL